jgi:hypothetical protein
MKKALIFLILITANHLKSQSYFPTLQEGATWSILTIDWSQPTQLKTSYTYKIQGDTTLDNVVYKQLHWLNHNGNTMQKYFYREDNRRVYLRYEQQYPGGDNYDYLSFQSNQEYLIYDYSLSIGDTVPSTYLTDNYLNHNVYYTIFSIDSLFIGGQYHKRFHINDSDGCDRESIIEGIGSTRGFIYPTNIYCPVYEFELLCYDLDTLHYTTEYSIQHFNSACDVSVGVEENAINNISTYPNPAQDFVSIEIPKNPNLAQLSIYNLTGQLISKKQISQPNQQISITELENGMYIFVIHNEDKVIGRQRVVVAK